MAKTKLTQQRHDAIVKLVREGNYINRACQAVGITTQTYDTWIREGEHRKQDESDIYVRFFQSIKKAEADFIAENVGIIQTAAKKNWFAAAWLLERKYPSEFGKRLEVGVGPSKMLLALQEAMGEELAKPLLTEGDNKHDVNKVNDEAT